MPTLLHQKKVNTIIFVFKSSMTTMVVFHAALGKAPCTCSSSRGSVPGWFLEAAKISPLSSQRVITRCSMNQPINLTLGPTILWLHSTVL